METIPGCRITKKRLVGDQSRPDLKQMIETLNKVSGRVAMVMECGVEDNIVLGRERDLVQIGGAEQRGSDEKAILKLYKQDGALKTCEILEGTGITVRDNGDTVTIILEDSVNPNKLLLMICETKNDY